MGFVLLFHDYIGQPPSFRFVTWKEIINVVSRLQYRMPSMLRSLAAPILILLTAALHLPAIRGAQQPSQLCSCSDLLWRPAPPHIPEVVNWHSKLLNELAEAEAQGVRHRSVSHRALFEYTGAVHAWQ